MTMNDHPQNVNQNEIDESLDWMINSLEHHGVEGQSWGKRHGPPYPLNRQDKAEAREDYKKKKAAEKAKKEKERTKKRIAKTQAKAAKKEANEQKAAERKAEKLERDKKKYSKTAKDLYEHRELFTYQEIADALYKFEWENKIKDYMDRDFTRSKNHMDTFANYSKRVVDVAKTGIDAYNIIASLDRYINGDNANIKPFKLYKADKNDKEDKNKSDNK